MAYCHIIAQFSFFLSRPLNLLNQAKSDIIKGLEIYKIESLQSMKKIFFWLLFLWLGGFWLSPAIAAEFDPDYLISDSEIQAYNAMGLDDIQRFLDRKSGTLKNYITVDKEDNLKSATQTFFEVSNRWMINPKYLLVLVQKEMSLLTDTSPKQTQYDWATGYGCFDNQSCNNKYKGFYRQVNSAAAQTRYYLDNIQEFNYRPGRTYAIDGQSVTPKNTATAGLYNYTPHIHGNELFWNLWNTYFGKKWPDGALLQSTSTDQIYYIQDGKKREVISQSVLLSRFDINKVVLVSEEDLKYYDEGVPVKYHNFSLASLNPQSEVSPIYMIVDDKKRRFADRALVQKIGLQADEIIQVTANELNSYENGADITEFSLYPAGTLVQNISTNETFYIINGRKRLVVNDEIMEYNFTGMPIEPLTGKELNKYRTGNPVTLPDGELIKSKTVNTVYVISDGKRLPIFNGDIFHAMNYKWENVLVVNDETLAVHELGQTITGDW